jgi:hypothetical protein
MNNDIQLFGNNKMKKETKPNKNKKKQRVYLEPDRILRYMQDNASTIVGARGNQAYILAATSILMMNGFVTITIYKFGKTI